MPSNWTGVANPHAHLCNPIPGLQRMWIKSFPGTSNWTGIYAYVLQVHVQFHVLLQVKYDYGMTAHVVHLPSQGGYGTFDKAAAAAEAYAWKVSVGPSCMTFPRGSAIVARGGALIEPHRVHESWQAHHEREPEPEDDED